MRRLAERPVLDRVFDRHRVAVGLSDSEAIREVHVNALAHQHVHREPAGSDRFDLRLSQRGQDVAIGYVHAELVAAPPARGMAPQSRCQASATGVAARDSDIDQFLSVVPDGVDAGAGSWYRAAPRPELREAMPGPVAELLNLPVNAATLTRGHRSLAARRGGVGCSM